MDTLDGEFYLLERSALDFVVYFLVDTPDEGALREVILEILPREGHRYATVNNAKIQLDSAWGMDNVYGGT